MKTNRILAVTLALVTFGVAGSVLAQYQPKGDDGITASPKLRQFLDERHRNEVMAAPAPQAAEMPCPKCADKITTRVDRTARGANKPTILVSSHLCGGCDNKVVTTGVGKAATSTAVHSCTGCGVENLACCNTMKDAKIATKGMEKKGLDFDVAPLK